MNPQEPGGESFNPLMDIDSWLSFCHGRGGGGSGMDEQLESELMSIIGNTNDCVGRLTDITPPAMQASSNTKQRNFSYDFPSFINSAEATSVTTMALPRGFMNIPNVSTTAPLENTCTMAMHSNIVGGSTTGLSRSNPQGNGAVKVKKKRVRASRRVPTTVLRTDTSNFKAMVQHFTGIPPESSSSSSSSPSSSCTSTTSTSVPSSSEPPFTKPLPHPAVCKMPPSTSNNSSTSATSTATIATATITVSTTSVTAPVSSSVSNHGGHFSFQDISSPLLISNIFNTSTSPSSDANDDGGIPDEQITMPAMDAAFFEKLWS